MPSLRIRLLGSFQVWLNDELISPQDLPPQKTRDLLKILVTERGHVVPVDRLVDWLWPDLSISSATNSLRVAVSRLRRLLEPERARGTAPHYVFTSGQAYGFQATPDVWIDVDAFLSAVGKGQEAEWRTAWGRAVVAYQAAEELYRGDYLEENLYDDWAMATREHLRVIRLDMLSRLAHCHAQQGHYRRALEACQRVLAVDPLRESVYRQVMLYHSRLGQRDQALRAYERCRTVLVEELGVDPLPETQQVYTQILRDEAFDAPALERPPVPPAQPIQRTFLTWLPFVGREAEMEALNAALQRARQGQPHMVLVEGETGVGKSRLCEEFLAVAIDQGTQVFRARAFDVERDLAYQPLRAALRRYLSEGSSPDTLQTVLGPWAGPIALLLPELRQLLPAIPPLPPATAAEERQQVIDALTQFCLTLATTRPTVFYFDDLQWADPATLNFLHYLILKSGNAPLLLVGTCCFGQMTSSDHPLHVIERSLVRYGLITKIHVPRLSPQAVDQLVQLRADPGWNSSAFSQRIYEETEGNPLFLAELLRSLFESNLLVEDDAARWQSGAGASTLAVENLTLPATMHDVILARCADVSEVGWQVLRTAAVIGRTFSVGLLWRVLSLDDGRLLDALDDLTARQLIEEQIVEGEGGYRFSHDKIREVIYGQLSQARRQHLHAQVAAAMEQGVASLSTVAISRLAHHYAEVGNRTKAVAYLIRAGDQARTLYIPEQAIQFYRRALAMLPTADDYELRSRTLMKLGLAYQLVFDSVSAHQAYDEAFRLWQRTRLAPQPSLDRPQSLRIGWSLNITTLDPNLAWDSNSTGVVDQLFCGLAEHSPELEVIPELADSWEVLEGGHRLRFYLRQDVTWSDGAPITAQDFEFSWKRLLHPATHSPNALLLDDIRGARQLRSGAGPVDGSALGIRVVDDHTLEIDLETPSAHFLQLLSHNATYPLPRHVVTCHGSAWTDPANIVTSGPFRLVSWQPDELLGLERNPAYRGRFHGNVARLELHLQPDQQGGLALYDGDGLDILRLDYPQGLGVEGLRRRYLGQYISIAMLHTAFLGFIVDIAPLDDERVRRALALAIDREYLANVVLQGFVSPAAGGFVPPGMPTHSAAGGATFDVPQARALLTEAGYPGGAGFPLLKGRIIEGERWRLMSRCVQQQWREGLGIDSQWESVEMRPGVFVDRSVDHPLNLFMTGWFADYPDPDTYLRGCPILQYTGWHDAAYDALIAQAGQVLDHARRMTLYQQAEAILMDRLPIVPLSYGREHRLVKPWVTRLPTSTIKWWFWKDVVVDPSQTVRGEIA